MGLTKSFAVSVATITLLAGCLAPQSTQMVGVDTKVWSEAESISYNNSDTLALRNLNIAVRYNSNFKQDILPLKVTVTAPDSLRCEEIIELQLRRPRHTFIVATTEKLPYRTDVILNQRGEYIFCFEPLCEVVGLEAIGIEF